jgi:CDP-paratose 2-epimerase
VSAGPRAARHVLVTGGAGFIGTNLADRLARQGERVLLYDDLSRPGVERNALWLAAAHGPLVGLERADVRNPRRLAAAVREASAVFHLAAQVAVTTSLDDPRHDFDVNARGTLEVLEAVRARPTPPPLLYTSTNKVYGALEDVELAALPSRYAPLEASPYRRGVPEERPLDLYSPYGCSKGCADQYVLDYARTYGVPAAVFRMSCIYGPHQHGNEDQGWLAHLLRAGLRGETVTLYGDGKQVRDALFVDDLVDALLLARASMRRIAGEAFNVGGGSARTLSLLELLATMESLQGARPPLRHDRWRTGDQRWYVSDTRKLERALGWRPVTGLADGVRRLHGWLRDEERPPAPAPSEVHLHA